MCGNVAPNKEGKWVIKTSSAISSLNNQQSVISCKKNKNPNINEIAGNSNTNHQAIIEF